MKLFRKDLEDGLNKRLFEINAESLGFYDKVLRDDKLSCLLSSKIIGQGFRVRGTLTADIIKTCDRCLKEYSEIQTSYLNLILTSNNDLFQDNENMVLFPESEEYLEMNNIVKDQILLELPMKTICSPECRGLCQKCGSDLNRINCV
ncbi:MAG: DUF177 domain-containing protein [Candidatus Neomarinimicrobiota bacterium]